MLIVLDVILVALAGIIFALAVGTWDFTQLYLLTIAHPYLAFGAYIANYVVLVLALGVVIRLYLFRDIWGRIANSVTIYGLEAADNVQARGDAVNALGEGFADSLNIGGF